MTVVAFAEAHAAVSDALARYASAVDARDSGSIAQQLDGARLRFRDVEHEGAGIGAFYAQAFARSHVRTLHAPQSPTVRMTGGGVEFEARYLRFVLELAGPRLDGAGIYQGRLSTDDWAIERLIVDNL